MGVITIKKINVKELWRPEDTDSQLMRAAMTYAEVTGFSDNWLEESNIAEDIDDDINNIFNDIDLQLDIETLYMAQCMDEFKDSIYYKDTDWDYSNEAYKGDKSYEEFLDMIKNNK